MSRKKRLTVADIQLNTERKLDFTVKAVVERLLQNGLDSGLIDMELETVLRFWVDGAGAKGMAGFFEEHRWEGSAAVDPVKFEPAMDALGPAARALLLGIEEPDEEAAALDMLPWVRARMEERDWEGLLDILPLREDVERDLESGKIVFGPVYAKEIRSVTSDKGRSGTEARWIRVLAVKWLNYAVQRANEMVGREERGLDLMTKAAGMPLNVKWQNVDGKALFVKAPKMTVGLSWGFGASGLSGGYESAPNMAVLLPRGYKLLGVEAIKSAVAGENKAHTMTLPLELVPQEQPIPLALALTGVGTDVLSPVAGKMALALLTDTLVDPQKMRRTTFGELARLIYPDVDRLRPREFELVAEGLTMLDGIKVVWPNGRVDRIFDVQYFKGEPSKDAPLVLGLARSFLEGTLKDIAKETGHKALEGQFIYNFKAAMALDNRRPGMLRQYLRIQAMANDYWDYKTKAHTHESVPVAGIDPVTWAVWNNYMPNPDADSLDLTKRKAKSEALEKMEEDARELESMGLIVIDTWEKHRIRLLVNDETLAVWKKFREGRQ